MVTKSRNIAAAAKHVALATLGEKLRKARLLTGLTQHAVGSQLDVTGQTVRNWETGRNEPSQEAIESLAAIYNLHPAELKAGAPFVHPDRNSAHSRERIKVDPQDLTQARKDTGLSQADAAQRSGINITSIRRYERGIARPTRTALRRLALIYGKPDRWLDPDCPEEVVILDSSGMNPTHRIYLELQPELTDESIKTIGEFILRTHQLQTGADREQILAL